MLNSIKNKKVWIIIGVSLICSVAIAIGVYSQITQSEIIETKDDKIEKKHEELKNNFNTIFNNNIENIDIIDIRYDLEGIETGKYNVNINIPMFKIENEETKKINDEIYNTFVPKVIEIATKADTYTIYTIDFATYINNDICSIIIRCTMKEGSKPQRIMYQAYNYDFKNNKVLSINDIIEYRQLNKSNMQDRINKEITDIIQKTSDMSNEGYNLYKRNIEDDIYKIDNTQIFFLDNEQNLYIIYAYGNNNYTSATDLVIF